MIHIKISFSYFVLPQIIYSTHSQQRISMIMYELIVLKNRKKYVGLTMLYDFFFEKKSVSIVKKMFSK
jgi:hypothetical protein